MNLAHYEQLTDHIVAQPTAVMVVQNQTSGFQSQNLPVNPDYQLNYSFKNQDQLQSTLNPDQYDEQQSITSFDEFLEKFDDLFKRTISDEDKEEEDFAPEYAQLVKVLREFINKSKVGADWSRIFIDMQGKIDAFKKPLRTLDKQGDCWKHTKEIQTMCSGQ